MHDARTVGFPYRELFLTDMMHHCVRKRVRIVSGPWMHRDANGFIEHDQIRILKEDLKWKIQRFEVGLIFAWSHNLDTSSIADLERWLHNDLTVNRDNSFLDPSLNLRATTHQGRSEVLNDNLIQSRLIPLMLNHMSFIYHRATSA
jgi:hypothetical protein